MNQQFLHGRFEKAGDDVEGVSYRVTLNSGNPDREKDRISPSGWRIPSHVPLLWSHDPKQLPIGKVTAVSPVGTFLRGRVQFPPVGVYSFADQVRALIDCGMLPGLSVGFMPTADPTRNELGGYDFAGQKLHELSVVNIPANIDAAIDGRAMRKWLGAVATEDVLALDDEQDDVILLDDDIAGAVANRLADGVARSLRSKWDGQDDSVWGASDLAVDINLDAIPAADPAARHTRYRSGPAWDGYGRHRHETGISQREALAAIRETVPELIKEAWN
jgi:HK97 family phage prohead protease